MTTEADRNCEHISELLPGYSVGAVTPSERLLVETHMPQCPKCKAELAALEQTGYLLDAMKVESAPDLWDAIRPNLTPRPANARPGGFITWLGRYRLQSAVAATAAAVAVMALITLAPRHEPQTEAEARTYIAHHASMNWREPFADKAGLGFADTTNIEVEDEQ